MFRIVWEDTATGRVYERSYRDDHEALAATGHIDIHPHLHMLSCDRVKQDAWATLAASAYHY